MRRRRERVNRLLLFSVSFFFSSLSPFSVCYTTKVATLSLYIYLSISFVDSFSTLLRFSRKARNFPLCHLSLSLYLPLSHFLSFVLAAMDAVLTVVDTVIRLALSLIVVAAVIALCWWAAYALLLQHVPIVRELLGRGRKQTRSGQHQRRVVLLPGARLQPLERKKPAEKREQGRSEDDQRSETSSVASSSLGSRKDL
jgi:hypothetical protein